MQRLFRLVNPWVVRMLRSPLHVFVSANIIALEMIGRRSGKTLQIPVSYLSNGTAHSQTLFCMTQRDGVWWKNLLERPTIRVDLRGRAVQARASVEVEDTALIRAKLAEFCRHSRASAYFSEVAFGRDGEPKADDLDRAAVQHVLIQLELEPPARD